MNTNIQKIGILFLAFFIFLVLPLAVFARIGVGVGIGKMQVEKKLKPGMVLQLPSLPILNTGDEPSEYEATVEYHEGVPELWPPREWISFNPQKFYLEPGKVQQVEVTLSVSVKAQPGDYFCYLEGHPIKKKSGQGGASIGVAAAAKLYFTVVPANIFQGIYYRFISLYSRYHPWDTIILAIIFAAILILLFRKRFKIQIARK